MCKRSASITVAGLALGSLLLAGPPAWAQSVHPPSADQRQAYPQQRVQPGIDSGAVTPGETRHQGSDQGRFSRVEARGPADGNRFGPEPQQLYPMQNQAGGDMRRLENNHRTASGWGGNYPNGWGGHTNSAWGGNGSAPGYERREAYQERQIQQGIHSGALTPGEARYLEREQARIDRAENRMLADGNLSPRERQRLNQMQNQASRDIYRLENNQRTGPGYHGSQAGWQGNHHGGDGRDYGWHGRNPVGAGHHPGGYDYGRGWHGAGNSGWQGHNPGGNPNPAGGPPSGGNPQGWHGSGNAGWQGHNPGSGSGPGVPPPGGTTTAGTTPRGPGNYGGHGQPGAYQQPGPQAGTRPAQPPAWQGPQYQQARLQTPSPQMRSNAGMTPRQPSFSGGMVNRAGFAAPRTAARRR